MLRALPFPLALGLLSACAREPVDQRAKSLQEFDDHVNHYQKLRSAAASSTSALTVGETPAAIHAHEQELANKIRQARPNAQQGEIFTPNVAQHFHSIIDTTMRGSEATRVETSLKHAEPVSIELRVNESYPLTLPLQSTPPTLLANLPKLPPELEYRVVGHALVLRDVGANLIVDFLPDALP